MTIGQIDRRMAREIADAYAEAAADLRARIVAAYDRLPAEPTPAQIRGLLAQTNLLQAINTRLAQLETVLGQIVRRGLVEVSDETATAIAAEVAALATAAGVTGFSGLAVDLLLEETIATALEEIPGLVGKLQADVRRTVRTGMARGDRMQEITRALFGRRGESGIFPRGLTSARLMSHRVVSEAENGARLRYLEQAADGIPGMRKQASARIDGNTSDTCLRAHGQIQDIDQPFSLTGRSRLGRALMAPPFHWGPCRTVVTGWHPAIEGNTSTSTDAMREAAARELASRQ